MTKFISITKFSNALLFFLAIAIFISSCEKDNFFDNQNNDQLDSLSESKSITTLSNQNSSINYSTYEIVTNKKNIHDIGLKNDIIEFLKENKIKGTLDPNATFSADLPGLDYNAITLKFIDTTYNYDFVILEKNNEIIGFCKIKSMETYNSYDIFFKGINDEYEFKLSLNKETNLVSTEILQRNIYKCFDIGECTIDCIDHWYTEEGWTSVALWVTTLVDPYIGVAAAAGCAGGCIISYFLVC